MRICVTTIVSANYLAYAKVLAASVREHFADAAFRVLVVDRKTPAVCEVVRTLPFEVVWAEELGLAGFERIAYQFDILELNTGLKPTLLKRLLSEGYDAVIYWDPDIRLFAPPTPVVEALQRASVVLTPHALAPLLDGHRPSDIDLMRHGAYNLGFIAVRGDTTGGALLDWWEERCLSYGFNDPALGTFVDQRWLDLAACYFDSVYALKHRGCNVAYWNLHERVVADTPQGLYAGDVPLVFFHFSGVDARQPGRLSKYQNRHPLVPGSTLHRLVADYCSALGAAGHAEYGRIAYTFGTLSDGRPISALMRRALGSIGAHEARPFDATSALQRRLLEARIASPTQQPAAPLRESRINSFNFDRNDRRVVWVNRLLRTAGRWLGLERLQQLLRYFNFLARGSNLAAVLTDAPFVLDHTPHRALPAPVPGAADESPRPSRPDRIVN